MHWVLFIVMVWNIALPDQRHGQITGIPEPTYEACMDRAQWFLETNTTVRHALNHEKISGMEIGCAPNVQYDIQ